MAMKLPEVVLERRFNRVFVCRKCKAKVRANPQKVLAGKVKCPRCHSKYLRPKRKDLKRGK